MYNSLVTKSHKTGKFSKGINSKRLIVMHYTAGANFSSAVQTLSSSRAKVSCHFVIAADGTVAEIATPEHILWHVGKSAYKFESENNRKRTNLNAHSIGIELDNPGILEKSSSGTYITYFGRKYHTVKDNLIVFNQGKNAFLPYPEIQFYKAFELCEELIKTYPSIEAVVGHEEVATPDGRKIDPGNGYGFPMQFYSKLQAQITDSSKPEYRRIKNASREMKVSVQSNLRLRSAATTKSTIIGYLKDDQVVAVIEENYNGMWMKVIGQYSHDQKEFEGWVSSAYLEKNG